MLHPLAGLAPLLLAGCLMDSTPCGADFVEGEDGRCVPARAATARDGSTSDPDGATVGGLNRLRVRIKDTTFPPDLGADPGRPGVDLDAVVYSSGGAETYGISVEAAEILGGPAGNTHDDVSRAIGPPDGEFVSLGGGLVEVVVELSASPRDGDVLTIHAPWEARFEETYDLEVCLNDEECVSWGSGVGTIDFSWR